VSELEICCSAKPSISQGTQISMTANSASGFQRGNRGRTWLRARAMGISSSAANDVRGQHQKGGRDLLDGHLDEQVGDAPDDAHRGEQDPPALGHRRGPLLSRLSLLRDIINAL
jgi:hypothetical protein